MTLATANDNLANVYTLDEAAAHLRLTNRGCELSEAISDAGHTVADGLRHDIERIQYEVRRLREVHANQPDWEKLWAEVSEENDRLRTLLTEAVRFYPAHDSDPKVNLIGKEIRELVGC